MGFFVPSFKEDPAELGSLHIKLVNVLCYIIFGLANLEMHCKKK